MRKQLVILLLCSTLGVTAQDYNYRETIDWKVVPKAHAVSNKYQAESAVGILDERKVEYVVQQNDAFILSVNHRIIRINDDKGIEMYNKVYIPVYRKGEIIDVKARTILKNGKVIDLPVEKIKEIEEDGRTFKLFAMEGVEKGAEVEYSYTSKRPMTSFGLEVFQGSNIPYQEVNFTLITPSHLKFDIKGYNGFNVSKDSVIGDKRIIAGFDRDIEPLYEEKYAVISPALKRVQYKLSYNLGNSNDRLYTWKDFSQRIVSAYTSFTEKEEKALDTWAKQINFSSSKNDGEKILVIEDFIKTNINIDEKIVGEDVDALDKVLKTRNTNRDGSIKLFAGLFDRFGISYDLVFPGSRAEFPIDEDLENWNLVEEVFFHFPKSGKFISPMSSDLRYPYVPPYYAGTKGLFIKIVSVGTFKTANPVFATIDMEPYNEHAINMEAYVKFDSSLDTLLITSKQILKGYGAVAYRPIYTFLPKDKQDEVNREIIKNVANSTIISNIVIENPSLKDYFTNKPLVIGADIKSTELVERAGDKLLFKLGEIIGPQVEMYQERPRQLPVELDYPHVLDRTIVFEIPEGYKVKNLDDININISHKENDVVTMGFISSYVQKGNIVTVHIEEIYRNLRYPLVQFEEFKNVINAAADFNKVVLVLEKK